MLFFNRVEWIDSFAVFVLAMTGCHLTGIISSCIFFKLDHFDDSICRVVAIKITYSTVHRK